MNIQTLIQDKILIDELLATEFDADLVTEQNIIIENIKSNKAEALEFMTQTLDERAFMNLKEIFRAQKPEAKNKNSILLTRNGRMDARRERKSGLKYFTKATFGKTWHFVNGKKVAIHDSLVEPKHVVPVEEIIKPINEATFATDHLKVIVHGDSSKVRVECKDGVVEITIN